MKTIIPKLIILSLLASIAFVFTSCSKENKILERNRVGGFANRLEYRGKDFDAIDQFLDLVSGNKRIVQMMADRFAEGRVGHAVVRLDLRANDLLNPVHSRQQASQRQPEKHPSPH